MRIALSYCLQRYRSKTVPGRRCAQSDQGKGAHQGKHDPAKEDARQVTAEQGHHQGVLDQAVTQAHQGQGEEHVPLGDPARRRPAG